MTTPEERDYIGEVIREDAATRCAVIGAQNVNSAMSTIDELRQQLADVSNERDGLRAALEGLVKSNEEHDADIAKVVAAPPGWKDEYLDAERKALRGKSPVEAYADALQKNYGDDAEVQS